MSEDKDKKNVPTPKKAEVKNYKVKKEFTLDKLYKVGSSIELSEGKVKETLTSNKFI